MNTIENQIMFYFDGLNTANLAGYLVGCWLVVLLKWLRN